MAKLARTGARTVPEAAALLDGWGHTRAALRTLGSRRNADLGLRNCKRARIRKIDPYRARRFADSDNRSGAKTTDRNQGSDAKSKHPKVNYHR